MNQPWYKIKNEEEIDSPALLVYPERVTENIALAIRMAGSPQRLAPHGKTHKTVEGFQLMIAQGIDQFKCATIPELELAAQAGAKKLILSYQPIGPKIQRLLHCIDQFPGTTFTCLVDDPSASRRINEAFASAGKMLPVYIDLNVGMNRTGVEPGPKALALFEFIREASHLRFEGLHAYDGHIRDLDMSVRKQRSDEAFGPVLDLRASIRETIGKPVELIAGGSPTFPIHAAYPDRICSPGTFIFWDRGYETACPEQAFRIAAALLCRVISLPSADTICVDLGHKAVAAENELTRRVYFPDDPELTALSQSEEHLVLKTGAKSYAIGDVLYGIPYHICPTVALYNMLQVVKKEYVSGTWEVAARRRI